jgi:VCBS repeat-containing protein
VSTQDIQGASTALERALTQDATAAYQAELVDGERLLTPVACSAQVKADHPTGSEAAQVSVTVQARGTLLYQWGQSQQRALSVLVAGKSEAQAATLLEQQPGISTVTITMTGRDTSALPTDPGRIQFVFVTYGQ